MSRHIRTDLHRLDDATYAARCREALESDGALVLSRFFAPEAVAKVVEEFSSMEDEAFFAHSSHNVYLTDSNPTLPADHPFNLQVASSKGLLADDQIPADSPLREVYGDPSFQTFLCRVLDIPQLYPYADPLSSINVHFAPEGRELGWHFDNSSFAVTLLLRAPEGGGRFEYVPAVRDAARGDQAFERVGAILRGREEVKTLDFEPGDLVLFRGRDALHRVTPTEGPVSRMLVVFAYNDAPGVRLSDTAMETFFGRVV